MTTMYSCPKCGQVFSEAHQIQGACPKCGQAFDRAQLVRIAKSTRWQHVLILTFLVGLPAGLLAGMAAADALKLVPPTKGIVALGVAAVVTAVVGFLIRAYDRWRYG